MESKEQILKELSLVMKRSCPRAGRIVLQAPTPPYHMFSIAFAESVFWRIIKIEYICRDAFEQRTKGNTFINLKRDKHRGQEKALSSYAVYTISYSIIYTELNGRNSTSGHRFVSMQPSDFPITTKNYNSVPPNSLILQQNIVATYYYHNTLIKQQKFPE